MNPIFRTMTIAAIGATVWSCDVNTKDCCVPEIYSDVNLEGSWLLFETGYSPGGGYATDQIDSTPAQLMNFEFDHKFSSNIQGLEVYDYYLVLTDSLTDSHVLALYRDNPGDFPQDVNELDHSYAIKFDENRNLKLHFRFCIEGCHLALKPVANSPAE